jgi:hypothetical protein
MLDSPLKFPVISESLLKGNSDEETRI